MKTSLFHHNVRTSRYGASRNSSLCDALLACVIPTVMKWLILLFFLLKTLNMSKILGYSWMNADINFLRY